MTDFFNNRDGWYDKYIKNTGPVGFATHNKAPHWQCIKCDFNDGDIGKARYHVWRTHDNPVRKDTVGAFYALDDSLGG